MTKVPFGNTDNREKSFHSSGTVCKRSVTGMFPIEITVNVESEKRLMI
ncbi:MAG: hypothetical protein JW712_11500 [Dehalococcoidales bacterium]|nr:hypothetical protein [Dehalococcoidales bacterium]